MRTYWEGKSHPGWVGAPTYRLVAWMHYKEKERSLLLLAYHVKLFVLCHAVLPWNQLTMVWPPRPFEIWMEAFQAQNPYTVHAYKVSATCMMLRSATDSAIVRPFCIMAAETSKCLDGWGLWMKSQEAKFLHSFSQAGFLGALLIPPISSRHPLYFPIVNYLAALWS